MLKSKIRFTHDIPHGKMLLVLAEEKIFHVQDTDDVIGRILIDRKSGKFVFLKNIDQFVVSIIYICKSHIRSWNHDLFCLCITKIKQVIDHFMFFGFDDTVFFADIHDGTEFFLCHLIVVCLWIYMQQK